MVWGLVTGGVFLVMTAVMALKVEHVWQRVERWAGYVWTRRRDRRELSKSDVRRISTAVVEDFRARARVGALYMPRSVDGVVDPLPLLVSENPCLPRKLDLESDDLLHVSAPYRVEFPVDEKLVRRQLAVGRRLTNDSVLYVITGDHQEPRYDVGVAGYRATVTLAHRVSRALESDWERSLEYGDLACFEAALASEALRPMVIGSDATCVFSDGNRLVVPVHRRSSKTVNAPGAYTVTPAYTYELNTVDSLTSRFGVVAYNFLREFLEELWADEDLVNTASRPRANPDWIFETPHGLQLLDEVNERRVAVYCTGVAVDLSHLCFTVALAVRFTSPEYLKYVMTAPGCYEAEATPGRPIVEFVELFGAQMDNRFRSHMKPTTAFSIDLARNLVRSLD